MSPRIVQNLNGITTLAIEAAPPGKTPQIWIKGFDSQGGFLHESIWRNIAETFFWRLRFSGVNVHCHVTISLISEMVYYDWAVEELKCLQAIKE